MTVSRLSPSFVFSDSSPIPAFLWPIMLDGKSPGAVENERNILLYFFILFFFLEILFKEYTTLKFHLDISPCKSFKLD